MLLFICLCFISFHSYTAFTPITSTRSITSASRSWTKTVPKKSSTHLHALFDDDDISDFDALCRFGLATYINRVTQKDKYWEAVEKYQRKEGCTEVEAVRNMDAYFTDPTGWVVKRQRSEKTGEPMPDYTGKSGVQKRPVFSAFWAAFCFWFFFIFLPTRIIELGGFHPSALDGGLCPPNVRVIDADGKEQFECAQDALGNKVGFGLSPGMKALLNK